jgi:hypothetical protein
MRHVESHLEGEPLASTEEIHMTKMTTNAASEQMGHDDGSDPSEKMWNCMCKAIEKFKAHQPDDVEGDDDSNDRQAQIAARLLTPRGELNEVGMENMNVSEVLRLVEEEMQRTTVHDHDDNTSNIEIAEFDFAEAFAAELHDKDDVMIPYAVRVICYGNHGLSK